MSMVDEGEPVEGDEEGEPGAGLTDEQKAYAQGWRPKDQFRGPPDQWKDATTYLRDGEENWSILRRQNRELTARQARHDQEIASLRNTVSQQRDAIEAAMDLARRGNEQGYQRGLRELKAKQREAADAGDVVVYDQTEEQIRTMEAERLAAESKPAPAAPPSPPPAAGHDPEYDIWWRENPWFFSDRGVDGGLNDSMIKAHAAVIQRAPGMSLRDQLAEAKAEIVAKFPEKFGVRRPAPPPEEDDEEDDDLPLRRRAASVARPSGGSPPPPSRRKGFDRIENPAEREVARAQYRKLKAQYADYTVDEFMSVYDDPHGDVLATQAEIRKRN